MSRIEDGQEYWVPEHVREYLRSMGYVLPLEAMEGFIRIWHEWMQASGSFYDYRDTDGFGRVYEVHRRSIHPAMRVCREWGSLLINDKTSVVSENQACTDWLADFFRSTGFMPAAQATLVRAFGMGTGAWALWLDVSSMKVRVRQYDARMVVPLTWDEEGVTECAFVTRVYYRGKGVDQLQIHQMGPAGTYVIQTVCFDSDGNVILPEGIIDVYDTGSVWPTFSLVKPAIDNTRVDMSPYGQSVFADAIDAIQAVDLTFDALMNEVDAGKMRIFLSDVMFDQREDTKGKRISIPFGKQDCTVFRKVTIRRYDFQRCLSLKSLVVPDNCTLDTYQTFKNCSALRVLDLGTGATVLSGANGGYSTLAGCTAMRKLVLRATSVVSLTTGSCLFTSSGTSVYVPPYLEGIYVPDDLVASYQTAANWSAFSTYFKPLSDLAAS